MFYKSYQHIEKLGTSETEGILKGEVHLSYKIDGSNGCIYLKDNFELMLKKYKDPTINFKLLRHCSNDFVKEIIGVSMKYIIGKIIDFEVKGNVVRFYLGNKTDEWGWTNKNHKDRNGNTPDWLKPSDTYYGDDWEDCPYECNAGTVYDEFIYGTRTYYYDMNWLIIEPCSGEINSPYCKNEFKSRKIPCVIVIKGKLADRYSYKDKFSFWWNFIKNSDYDKQEVECFYFEDYLMSGETLETEISSITI